MKCHACIAARVQGPCPHETMRALEAYGLAQYERGLSVGLEALALCLALSEGQQERDGETRPMPLSMVQSALRTAIQNTIRAAREAGIDTTKMALATEAT